MNARVAFWMIIATGLTSLQLQSSLIIGLFTWITLVLLACAAIAWSLVVYYWGR